MSTLFTRIIQGEIPCHRIWEDDQYFAFLDIHPIQPGMTLVIPKQEVPHVFDMDDASYAGLLLAAKHLVPAIQNATGCLRVGLVIEGLEVPHAHAKLIPINAPSDLAQSNAKEATQEELASVAEKIRALL
jgi:histidine triad (HIT) family protein